jgi:nucleoside 2-deoxyribosyltransferase
MKVAVVAEPERVGVTNDLISAIEKTGSLWNRLLGRPRIEANEKFSFENLLESDAVVIRMDQRSPEICSAIGFLWGLYHDDYRSLYKGKQEGSLKDVPVVALWNRSGKLPDYGFYKTIFSGNVAGTVEETMGMLKKWREKDDLPEKKLSEKVNVSEKGVVYVAGDVRNAESQQVLYRMGELMEDFGFSSIIPPLAVDGYRPTKHYCPDPCGIPESHFELVNKGVEQRLKEEGLDTFEDGVMECFKSVDNADFIFSRVDKLANMGPWIEVGYAVAKGMPVIGLNRYHWPKSFKSPAYSEITKHNAHWGLDGIVEWQHGERPRWMCYTKEHVEGCIDILRGEI